MGHKIQFNINEFNEKNSKSLTLCPEFLRLRNKFGAPEFGCRGTAGSG